MSNRHQNPVRITHMSASVVRIARTRSRENVRAEAMAAIHAEPVGFAFAVRIYLQRNPAMGR